tara:strand:- start:1391 stop:2164 length:774 start_codon:yes stop_codon:yes gene_type:complete
MTGADAVNAWFTPFHYFVYLFVVLVGLIVYYQWQWMRQCDNFVKVIEVKSDGSSVTSYAPKRGSSISITNPHTEQTKLWPITAVTTIEMLYPGDGFIPVFLQKKIRTVVVDENDWEPLLNRGSYSTMVASPDVKALIAGVAETLSDGDAKTTLSYLTDNLKTAPTREMIANPAILGNIGKEKVSELAVTVAKDIMNPLQDAIKKLQKQLNPTIVYIGLGLAVILLGYTIYLLEQVGSSGVGNMANDIGLIKQALGVK